MVRLREDRTDTDKKRDREFCSSRSKRIRLERYANLQWKKKDKDVENGGGAGDSSCGGSFGEECLYEEKYDGKTQSPHSKENHVRRSSFRLSPALSFRDDMIAVPVPRRARSTSLKRSNAQKRLCSTGKKMKELESKAEMRTAYLNPCSSLEDDIEIEVVEALFDLKNQSHSHSNNFQASSLKNSAEKLRCLPAEIAPLATDTQQIISSLSDGAHSEQPIKMGNANSLSKLEKMPSGDNAPNSSEKWNYPKDPAGDLVDRDESMTREQATAPEKESRLCIQSKSDDSTNPLLSKANSTADLVETKREDGINLMAHLPMPLSPEGERDVLTDAMPSTQMKSRTMVKDERLMAGNSHVEGKMQTIYIKQETAKLDTEKHDKDNVSSGGNGNSEAQNLAQSSSLPSPVAVNGWPGSSPLPGYIPLDRTILQMYGCARSSAGLQNFQAPPFKLFQPQPKRCIMHQHIARNINCHQQLTKNTMSPAAVTSASFWKSEPHCVPTASAPNSIAGKPLKGDLPVGQVLGTGLNFSGKCENSEAANTTDAFIAVFQKNSYPFPVPTNRGLTPFVKGAQPSVLPFINASYSPSELCVTQNQQKESTSQPDPSQQAPWNSSTSTCSSSIHNRSQNPQQIGNQTSGSGVLSFTAMKQESPSSRMSDRKSLAMPIQPINLALLSHRAVGCVGRNHPTVIQILPNIAQGGYQLVRGPLVAQQQNFLVAEGKSVISVASRLDGITSNFGKSVVQSINYPRLGSNNPSNFYMTESMVDGSPKYQHILPSTLTSSQCSGSSSTALNAAFSVNTPKSHPQQQQQGLIEFPEQHGLQLQLTRAAQVSSVANTSSLTKLSQQQQRTSNQSFISFGSSSNSTISFQGKQTIRQ